MRNRVGSLVSIVASLLFLVVLGWPYAVRSISAVNTYYGEGIVTPLIGGALVVGILVTFAAIRQDSVSSDVGAGIVLGLGLVTVLVSSIWAVTARVDVFRAPGWALPIQRFVLVGTAVLIVIGVGWHIWTNHRLFGRR